MKNWKHRKIKCSIQAKEKRDNRLICAGFTTNPHYIFLSTLIIDWLKKKVHGRPDSNTNKKIQRYKNTFSHRNQNQN